MNTAVTIPWEAVVNGRPPSQAKALPLVVSRCCAARSDVPGLDDPSRLSNLLDELREAAIAPLALTRCQGPRHTADVILKSGLIAVLTTDGSTSVVLQQVKKSARGHFRPAQHRDALVRRYVARYAALDADVPGFVPNVPDERHCWHFGSPDRWGFTSTTTHGLPSWTAHAMYQPITFSRRANDPNRALRPRYTEPSEQTSSDRGDPFCCLPELRQMRDFVRQFVDSHTPSYLTLVYFHDLALSLGRCRLFGVNVPGQWDFSLSPAAFWEASKHVINDMRDAQKLLTSDKAASVLHGAFRIEDHALELLETRMDAHAAYLALDEAYAAALYDGSPEVPAMSRRLTQVRRLINLFDGNLRKNLPLLRLAASTYLLDNWRRLLAPTYRDCPPWWLDGCIG